MKGTLRAVGLNELLGTTKYLAVFKSSPMIVTKQYQSSGLEMDSCFSFIIQPYKKRPWTFATGGRLERF